MEAFIGNSSLTCHSAEGKNMLCVGSKCLPARRGGTPSAGLVHPLSDLQEFQQFASPGGDMETGCPHPADGE